MIKLLRCEFQKSRRRFIALSAIGIIMVQVMWLFYALKGSQNTNSWLILLYQLPIMNTIFLPLVAIVISSRICDLEHKGGMFKKLGTMMDRAVLFDCKLLYGVVVLESCILFQWLTIIGIGSWKGFGDFPIKLYLLYLMFTSAAVIVIYILHHCLSILFKNQTISFLVGITGGFIGLFSLFFKQTVIQRILLWSYFGIFQLVGLFGWDKEMRMANAHFETLPIDWFSFGILLGMGTIIYWVGKRLFCKEELC